MTQWSFRGAVNDTFYHLPLEKRETIIKACQDEFIEHGYENASTNRIVKNAGISKGSLFQYFSSKEDIYLFILDQAVSDNLKYIVSHLDEIRGDLVQRMIKMAEIGMDYYFIDSNAFRMYLTVDMNPDPENTILTTILQKMLPQYMEIAKSLFADIDTKGLRMDLDKTLEFIKLPIAGYKMQFFNQSRMSQDPASLKQEFMQGLENVALFLKHAVYQDDADVIIENQAELKE